MRHAAIASLCASLALGALASTGAQAAPPAYLSAAVADPARPADDVARDAARKPAETLAFAGVRPGDTVIELIPGGGYFTRILAKAVGPSGHVYTFLPKLPDGSTRGLDKATAVAAAYPNVTLENRPLADFGAPSPADLVFTAQNYHDLHNIPGADRVVAAFDRAAFAALKPGGVFLVIDHAAPDGSGTADTNTLHRIDEAVVKSEAEAAGFKLDGEGDFLRNPADTRTLKVFDPAIRGHTDQFVLKFRKPG